MRILTSERPSPPIPAPVISLQERLEAAIQRLAGAIDSATASATKLIERVPATIDATRAGANRTTTALQTLPDPTLRSLVATSVGLGAGFYLAGAPRLAVVAGIAPALLVGAAIVLRPVELGSPVAAIADHGPARRSHHARAT